MASKAILIAALLADFVLVGDSARVGLLEAHDAGGGFSLAAQVDREQFGGKRRGALGDARLRYQPYHPRHRRGRRHAAADPDAADVAHAATEKGAPGGPAAQSPPVTGRLPGDDLPFSVDVVYCWGGEEAQGTGMVADADHSGKGFNEIWWSLRSLEKHMPWVNKIYILTDTGSQASFIEYESDVDKMVNRCTLFPRQEDCPTASSAACASVSHLVPGLSEQWVMFQDDFYLVLPTKKSDFFHEDGKPLVRTKVTNYEVPIYGKPKNRLTGPDVPEIPDNMPTRAMEFDHVPIPLTVSFAKKLEEDFPQFFAWIRSHTKRYTCCDKTGRTKDPGAIGHAEEFLWIYTGQMVKQKYAHHTGDGGFFCGCGQNYRKCVMHTLAVKWPFIVQNNCETSKWAASGYLDYMCLMGNTEGRILKSGTRPFADYQEADFEQWCDTMREVRDGQGGPVWMYPLP